MLMKSHFVYPSGKPMIPHLLRYQGFAVGYYAAKQILLGYGFTLDALELGHPRLSLD